jgi:hypothetical protein
MKKPIFFPHDVDRHFVALSDHPALQQLWHVLFKADYAELFCRRKRHLFRALWSDLSYLYFVVNPHSDVVPDVAIDPDKAPHMIFWLAWPEENVAFLFA